MSILSDEEIQELADAAHLVSDDSFEDYKPYLKAFTTAVIEAYRAKRIAGVVIPEPHVCGDKYGLVNGAPDLFTLTQLQEAIEAARLQGAKEERENLTALCKEYLELREVKHETL